MKKLAAIISALFAICGLMFTGCSTTGEFYELEQIEEVYNRGDITKEDLLSIAYYMTGGRDRNKDLMPEDYAPKPKEPETLNAKLDLKIRKQALAHYHECYGGNSTITVDDLEITNYFGTYNGYKAN